MIQGLHYRTPKLWLDRQALPGRNCDLLPGRSNDGQRDETFRAGLQECNNNRSHFVIEVLAQEKRTCRVRGSVGPTVIEILRSRYRLPDCEIVSLVLREVAEGIQSTQLLRQTNNKRER